MTDIRAMAADGRPPVPFEPSRPDLSGHELLAEAQAVIDQDPEAKAAFEAWLAEHNPAALARRRAATESAVPAEEVRTGPVAEAPVPMKTIWITNGTRCSAGCGPGKFEMLVAEGNALVANRLAAEVDPDEALHREIRRSAGLMAPRRA